MNTRRLNIAIKPSKSTWNYAIEISKKLAQKSNALFVLDGINFLPHLTIYSPEFPENNGSKVIEYVRNITSETSALQTQFTKFDPEDGFIGINVERTDELFNLHKQIVTTLNPLRGGTLREKYTNPIYLNELTEEKRTNIKQYGYPNLFKRWIPHLTLIRFENEKTANTLINKIEWELETLMIESIGIFEMGPNGTCTNLIEDFQLK